MQNLVLQQLRITLVATTFASPPHLNQADLCFHDCRSSDFGLGFRTNIFFADFAEVFFHLAIFFKEAGTLLCSFESVDGFSSWLERLSLAAFCFELGVHLPHLVLLAVGEKAVIYGVLH